MCLSCAWKQVPEERSSEEAEQKLEAPVLKEERKSDREEEEEELQLVVKEEALGSGIPDETPRLAPPWENDSSEQVSRDPPPVTGLKEGTGDDLPIHNPPHHSPPQDRGHDSTALSSVECSMGRMEGAGTYGAPNHVGTVLPTLKQRPLPVLPSRDLLSDEEVVPSREEPCFGYTPALYPKGNPGIMSPLAKKKMLSQVSGTNPPNSYSFGLPPPLINSKCANGGTEELNGTPGPPGVGAETPVINRPSVIQHAQSFKPRETEVKKPLGEACNPAHAPPQPLPQASPAGDPYLPRADPHDSLERKVVRPSQMPSYLCDFYSSPHLHNLYRQTEHHLSQEQLSKYLSREASFSRDGECIQGFPPAKHPENHRLSYGPHLSQKDCMTTGKRSPDDQPTDLSLPKLSPHKMPGPQPSMSRASHSMNHQDMSTPPLFQVGLNQTPGMDYHPRACRVPPMTMSSPKKPVDTVPRAGSKLQNGRGEDIMGYKIEEMSRPILSTKSTPQNVCAARPLKRNPEEPENGPLEKKIRVVTPMHSNKEASVRSRTPEPQDEGMKPAEPMHGVHVNSYTDGHKFPLHSPIFPGLYPGAFLSQVQDMCDGLGSPLPGGYSHPLQYLKNQAVISPLVPPFAIHSFMMQRQLLASTAGPPHLYRHHAGASYGDLLHHGLYPMSALNPQPAFSPSQLPSVHPSTKLS